jgi:hypothetical protein
VCVVCVNFPAGKSCCLLTLAFCWNLIPSRAKKTSFITLPFWNHNYLFYKSNNNLSSFSLSSILDPWRKERSIHVNKKKSCSSISSPSLITHHSTCSICNSNLRRTRNFSFAGEFPLHKKGNTPSCLGSQFWVQNRSLFRASASRSVRIISETKMSAKIISGTEVSK